MKTYTPAEIVAIDRAREQHGIAVKQTIDQGLFVPAEIATKYAKPAVS